MNQSEQTKAELWDERLASFPKDSKVWVYQITKKKGALAVKDLLVIQERVRDFADGWAVHGEQALAYGDLLFGRFIVFVVSSQTPASGCSIDSSVHFLKELEKDYGLDLFNRMIVAYADPDTGEVKTLSVTEAKDKLKSGELHPRTYMFNNTITTLAQLDGEWIIPFRNSWLVK